MFLDFRGLPSEIDFLDQASLNGSLLFAICQEPMIIWLLPDKHQVAGFPCVHLARVSGPSPPTPDYSKHPFKFVALFSVC